MSFKDGKCFGILTFFSENGATIPYLSCKIFIKHRGKEMN